MTRPEWQKQGYLTPDAWAAQRDTWALMARLLTAQAEVYQALAERSVEPSWCAR